MNNIRYTDLKEYFSIYGMPYDEKFSEDETHQIIMDIIRKFFKRNIISINEGRKKKDKIRIHLYEINNFDLNASALQLGKKDFAIVMRSGIFQILFDEIGKNYEIFNEITETYYEDLSETVGAYYLFVYAYLIGHELGHIMQGHHSIASTSNLSENREILNLINKQSLVNQHTLYNRFLMELDADLYAVSFLIKLMLELKIKYKLLNDKSREIFYGDIYSVTKIAITSIYITHNLFAKKHNYKSDYPPPHIRTGFMTWYLKEFLGDIVNENKKELKELCEEQMQKIYDLQDRYSLSAFKINSLDDFNLNIIEQVKIHLSYYNKLKSTGISV